MSALRRGDVLARGQNVGIVAELVGDRVRIWPVSYRRAQCADEVAIDNLMDMATVRGTRDALVRVGCLLEVPVAGREHAGAISSGLLARIERAAARSAVTIRVVARWHGDREHRRDECQPPRAA